MTDIGYNAVTGGLNGLLQPVKLFGLCHDMVHVRHAAPPLHNHEVEPGTEEVELAFDELTLFLGGAHEIPQVLDALICLADAVPAVGPEVTLVAAGRCPGSSSAARIAIVGCGPAPEVAVVHVHGLQTGLLRLPVYVLSVVEARVILAVGDDGDAVLS